MCCRYLLSAAVLFTFVAAPESHAQFELLDRFTNVSSVEIIPGVSVKEAVEVGQDVAETQEITDADVRKMADAFIKYADEKHKIASPKSSYAKRIAKLTAKHKKVGDQKLDFKVYLSPKKNAFAVANGSIRIYSGLMDVLFDYELQAVIAHEIGHIQMNHSRERLVAAAQHKIGMNVVGNKIHSSVSENSYGLLSGKDISKIGEELLNARYSRAQEEEADDYSVRFLKHHRYDAQGAISALHKISLHSGKNGHGPLASHPHPIKRAKRLQDSLE